MCAGSLAVGPLVSACAMSFVVIGPSKASTMRGCLWRLNAQETALWRRLLGPVERDVAGPSSQCTV